MAKRKSPKDDEPTNENLNNDSDDSFGLPEIKYEPLHKTEKLPEPEQEHVEEEKYETVQEESVMNNDYQEETQPVEEEPYQFKSYEEEPSIWPKILGILFVIVLALGATWYFVIYSPKQKEIAEKARIEAEQKAAKQKAKDDDDNRLRLQKQAAEQRKRDSLEALKNPPAGTIEILTERTGRYYVVIASAIDNDLLMDYAKKLGAQGISSKIIPPFGKHKVSRITIAEGDTFNVAQAKADELKAEYGDALWVVKY